MLEPSISIPQVAQQQRHDATRRSMENAEIMEAMQKTVEDAGAIGGAAQSTKATLGLQRTTCQNAINTLKQKLKDMTDDFDKGHQDIAEQLVKVYACEGGSLSGPALEQKQDVETSVADAKKVIKAAQDGEVQALDEELTRSQSVAEVKVVQGQCAVIIKRLKEIETVKNAKTLITNTKRQLTVAERAGAKKRRREEQEAAEPTKPAEASQRPPMAAIVDAILRDGPINISPSMYEAKLGIKLAQFKSLPQRRRATVFAEDARKMQAIKTAVKASELQLKRMGTNHISAPFSNAGHLKKTEKLMREGLDAQCISRLVLPEEPWAKRIYEPEVYCTTPAFLNIFTTNNCVAECRIVLKGIEAIVGIPYQAVPGANFRDKRHHVSQLTEVQLKTLVESTKGFATKFDGTLDDVFMIPSGFLIISTSEGCASLRWGVSADDGDTRRVGTMIAEVMASFREFRTNSNPIAKLGEYIQEAMCG